MDVLNEKLVNLDRALNTGNLPLALDLGNRLVAEYPDSQHGWLSLSEANRLAGHTGAACDAARQAWELAPTALFAIAQYARCLMPYADHQLMSELVLMGIRSETENEWAFDTLASCAVSIDDWGQALILYERLLQGNPGNPHYLYMQALGFSVLGKTVRAIESLEKIRNDAQFSGRALNLIQDIDARKVDRGELAAVIHRQQEIPPQDLIYALQAMGRLHHSEQRFSDAFQCWQRANDLKAPGIRYNRDNWQAFAERLMQLEVSREVDSSQLTSCETAPVFIVGLPQSGTTLLERLLVNSGKVAALGELRDIEVLLQMRMGSSITPMPFDIIPEKANAIDWESLGSAYRKRIASRNSADVRPCDKNPFNFLFCGLILRALPDARIIHIKKHPLDAGLGNFRHIFAAAAPWSYRLEDIAHFYVLYDEVMSHWAALFPENIYTIHYDALVSAPSDQSRQLFRWLGLPWSESVTDTSGREGVVKSASANQVRSAIHQHAVQGWRHYESELSPLRDALIRANILHEND